jgi:hypothetical protein
MTERKAAMPTSAQHRLALVVNALGDNAEGIATRLQFGGWHGLPHDARACPIALYLRTVMTGVTDAAVSAGQATVRTSGGAEIAVELTPAAAGFVTAFDMGAYPELLVTTSDDNGDVIDDLDL